MKKIRTINKLLSSLTLLSPLSGIGFNNQYQNTQKVITENNSILNSYFNSVGDQRPMGDITVNVDGTTITGYVTGTGKLVVDSDITEIAIRSFRSNENITSLDLSQATSLTSIGNNAFAYCSNLTGDLVIPSSVTSVDYYAFPKTNITSLDLSQATSLTTIRDSAFQSCSNLTGDLVIPQNLTSISTSSFVDVTKFTSITVDPLNKTFSLASNLGSNAYVLISGTDGIWNDNSIVSIALGNVVIPSNVTKIQSNAFSSRSISSLNLSQATSLTSIGDNAFYQCSNLSGDLMIPSCVTTIGQYVFENTTIDNLYFSSETPPTSFGASWQPTLTGKVYVPSEAAKEAYLKAENFGFSSDQIDLWTPPESKSNTGLILGLLLGLGIPIILAAGFGIWYLTKKKKKTVKI